MNIPHNTTELQDSIIGKLPAIWAGTAAVDGDASPWKDVSVSSIYCYSNGGTAGAVYVKIADVPEDNDWAATNA